MKLTEWYEPQVKPVRNGWYECGVCVGGRKHYFSNGQWYADENRTLPFGKQNDFPWRGVLK